jgi:hypothetical protein
MPAPIIPWEPCNIPEEIQDEFNRRKKNRSLKYVPSTQGNWDSSTGDWSKYRGPMSPWVRLCSNSKGINGKEGFVLFGGKGFYQDYGFTAAKNNPSIIGYVPNGTNATHTIDNDLNKDYPIHVPAPEIERINVSIQKELYRRAEIEWVCFSKKQLEYMTPYFLVPGISCIMEWGWNHYNPVSLVDLADTGQLKDYFNNPYPLYTENILKSRGNYDVIFGIITNFEWTADGNKFRCKTEITSKDRIYSGLIVDSTAMDKSSAGDDAEATNKPFDSLVQFVDKSLDQFRNVLSQPPDSIDQLKDFCGHVRKYHPKNIADEYLYGVFFGRDPRDMKNKFQDKPDTGYDFDYQTKNSELWLNLGLVIEALNFHAGPLKATNGKEMFRVDIDDVVIGAHPNMISSDGSVCLIPNWESPHYFYGKYGPSDKIDKLKPSDSGPLKSPVNHAKAIADHKAPDWRLQDICGQFNGAYRDDIDQIINTIRYENGVASGTCCFPFRAPHKTLNNNPYPAHYSGYLKHIYVSLSFIKGLLDNSSDITTYYQLVEKLLQGVNGACGSFWDLRLVSGPGDKTILSSDPAPMKIVDYKFMSFSNRGKVWSFDYFDADSLLLGIGFKPTLSNAQAIRTIYAPTNNPVKTTTITNGNNELLDYKAEDRLGLGQNVGNAPTPKADKSGFEDTMRELQQVEPPAGGSYQITSGPNVYRLALPATDIQALLLDDSDEDNNPKYTGIMPGIQATFTVQGIGGLRTFMMFLVRNLPSPYSENNIVFRIVNLEENIESGNWTTTITAGVIPLRGFIKARLGIP